MIRFTSKLFHALVNKIVVEGHHAVDVTAGIFFLRKNLNYAVGD
jgi:hypothetical protein